MPLTRKTKKTKKTRARKTRRTQRRRYQKRVKSATRGGVQRLRYPPFVSRATQAVGKAATATGVAYGFTKGEQAAKEGDYGKAAAYVASAGTGPVGFGAKLAIAGLEEDPVIAGLATATRFTKIPVPRAALQSVAAARKNMGIHSMTEEAAPEAAKVAPGRPVLFEEYARINRHSDPGAAYWRSTDFL